MKKLAIGTVFFIVWVTLWAGIRPFVDYLMHSQEMNIGRDLVSGIISGVIFTAFFLFVKQGDGGAASTSGSEGTGVPASTSVEEMSHFGTFPQQHEK